MQHPNGSSGGSSVPADGPTRDEMRAAVAFGKAKAVRELLDTLSTRYVSVARVLWEAS